LDLNDLITIYLYISLTPVILTKKNPNIFKLSLQDSLMFPYIKMSAGVPRQIPKSLLQIVLPETYLLVKLALHSLSQWILISFTNKSNFLER